MKYKRTLLLLGVMVLGLGIGVRSFEAQEPASDAPKPAEKPDSDSADSGAASEPGEDSAKEPKAKDAPKEVEESADSVESSVATISEDQKIQHVLSRFAFTPTPKLVAQVKEVGLREWFVKQLEAKFAEDPYLTESLAEFETYGLSLQELHESVVGDLREKRREIEKAVREAKSPEDKRKAQRMQRELNQRRNLASRELIQAVLLRAVYSNNTIREVSADFFRNHFSVDLQKGEVRNFAPDYEVNAITKNALGNFGEMLDATAHHPAMLFFLDNHLSRRPLTEGELKELEKRVKRQAARTDNEERQARILSRLELESQRGLNENYARELLELHTLGVDNFYTQDDVLEVARALTGWTIERNPRRKEGVWGFSFVPRAHDGGERTVLGTKIPYDKKDPKATGEAILDMLKAHEGTAHYISWKLCRYLVNDTPSQAMVSRIEKVFKESKGDLKKVYLAIFDDPEFFAPENFQAKYKRPFEFVVSSLQATGAECRDFRDVYQRLQKMNEAVYRCPDPTGYYDQAEAWKDPGAMAIRWDFAVDLTKGKIRGVSIPREFFEGIGPMDPMKFKDHFAAKILPFGMSERTSAAIDRFVATKVEELESLKGKNRRNRRQLRRIMEKKLEIAQLVVGALIGGPDFNKQ